MGASTTCHGAALIGPQADSEAQRQVGITALTQLAEHADVTAEDKELIDAALDVPLAHVSTAWDDTHEHGGSVEVIDPEMPQEEP